MLSDQLLIERVKQLNSGITIRPAGAGDAEQVIALMNSQYTKKRQAEYFYWQFLHASSPCCLFVAYEKEVLAGFYGVRIGSLSDSRVCAFDVDLLLAAPYRKRGLFFLLEQEAALFASEHKAVAMTCLPNQAGMQAHAAVAGWRNLGRVSTFELHSRPDGGSAVVAPSTKESQLVSFFKDDFYQRWRYDLNPVYTYDFVHLETGQFAVVKQFVDPVTALKYGDIVDFNCSNSNWLTLEKLFRAAVTDLMDNGAQVITTWALPHTHLPAILRSLGFTEIDRERYFCVKILDPSSEDLYRMERWQLVKLIRKFID